ncbi:MAG TPA: hypothetical protein VFZ76_14395 [Anaerolineales bacterium]
MESTINANGEATPILWLTDTERQAMKDFWTIYDTHFKAGQRDR